MAQEELKPGQYTDVEYLQFSSNKKMRILQTLLGILTWPVVLPLALLSRLSDIIFRTASELLSLLPYFPGVIVRFEFYRFALRKCGNNVIFEFGTVFIYRDIEIGSNVLIGRFNVVHHCDFGSDILVGERCTFLSGAKQHHFARTDVPMTQQGGAKKRIAISDDCWVGSHCVVTDDIATGCIVGAGSIVTKPIPGYSIAVGVPATVVRSRSK